ncbi:unnamed protein product [Nezara viridula]|uniref:Uncharacterized protein n=1 Tax=Nezara viridula TaxID=85310 RepID=A0A9P0HEW6_NEZVI|nr:unnamed protein product [Nezara viridula]
MSQRDLASWSVMCGGESSYSGTVILLKRVATRDRLEVSFMSGCCHLLEDTSSMERFEIPKVIGDWKA